MPPACLKTVGSVLAEGGPGLRVQAITLYPNKQAALACAELCCAHSRTPLPLRRKHCQFTFRYLLTL